MCHIKFDVNYLLKPFCLFTRQPLFSHAFHTHSLSLSLSLFVLYLLVLLFCLGSSNLPNILQIFRRITVFFFFFSYQPKKQRNLPTIDRKLKSESNFEPIAFSPSLFLFQNTFLERFIMRAIESFRDSYNHIFHLDQKHRFQLAR